MEGNFKIKTMTEQLHLRLQHRFQRCRGIDIQLCRSAQQSEGTDHSYQPKAMVTMQMGNKDCRELGESDTRTAQLHLRALPTVNHKLLTTQFYYLGRSVMMECGKRTTAS
jgi:hypothetical protein